MQHLTNTQARILATLRTRYYRGESPPSYRDLCAEFGWASTATVRDHLRALARKGYVELPGHRGGRVRPLEGIAPVRSIPIVGRIVAGTPVPSEENFEELLPIPANWASSGEHFALWVRGDSMKDSGIFEGDTVVIRKQPIADPGDIVAATIDGETTLKRFTKRGSRTVLVPENSSYRPIEVKSDSAVIQGVVVGLLRNYRSERISRHFKKSVGLR